MLLVSRWNASLNRSVNSGRSIGRIRDLGVPAGAFATISNLSELIQSGAPEIWARLTWYAISIRFSRLALVAANRPASWFAEKPRLADLFALIEATSNSPA